jgi:hypothetical protein
MAAMQPPTLIRMKRQDRGNDVYYQSRINVIFFTSKNSDGVMIIGAPHHTKKSIRQKTGEFCTILSDYHKSI